MTILDPRYSDEGAQATPWEEARTALENAELFWVTSVRADGRPHVTPVVAVWAEDALYFSTGPEEQKFANLRANPNVVLTTGCNTWDHGLDIVVEGEAVRVTSDDILRRLASAWAAKWNGAWRAVRRHDLQVLRGCLPAPGNGQAVVIPTAGYYRIKAAGPGGSIGWVTVDVGVTLNTAPYLRARNGLWPRTLWRGAAARAPRPATDSRAAEIAGRSPALHPHTQAMRTSGPPSADCIR